MTRQTTLDVKQERKNIASLAELNYGFTPRQAERLAFIKWLVDRTAATDSLRNPRKAVEGIKK